MGMPMRMKQRRAAKIARPVKMMTARSPRPEDGPEGRPDRGGRPGDRAREEGRDDEGGDEPEEDADELDDEEDREQGEGEDPFEKSLLEEPAPELRGLEVDRVPGDGAPGLFLEQSADRDDVAPDRGRRLQGDVRADPDDGFPDLAADGDGPAEGHDALLDAAFDDDVAAEGDDVVLDFARRDEDVPLDAELLLGAERGGEAYRDKGEDGQEGSCSFGRHGRSPWANFLRSPRKQAAAEARAMKRAAA